MAMATRRHGILDAEPVLSVARYYEASVEVGLLLQY